MQEMYSANGRLSGAWCPQRNIILFQSSVVIHLTFFQDSLEKGLSFPTIKICFSAISACHVGFDPGLHPLVYKERTVLGSDEEWDHAQV